MMRTAIILIYRWTITALSMFIVGTIAFLLVFLSFGLLRNFFVRYVFSYGARLLLVLFGYQYKALPVSSFPKKQVIYVINHNSYLDIFMLSALGLPDTRYVLSEITFKFVYLTITAKAMGTFYIPQKKHGKRRLKFFIRMTEYLKRHPISLIVSAEGVRQYTHGIQPFNKGIFHMAMEAGLPMVPLYLHIPEELNPYKGKMSKTGKIHLEILGEVDTSGWKLESIWDEIHKFRQMYVDRFNELNGTSIT